MKHFICIFLLFIRMSAYAADPDFYYVDRDDRTPSLTYRGALMEYHFTFDRTLEGRLITHFDFQAFGKYGTYGLFAEYAKNLRPREEVALKENVLEIFDLDGRVFGILDDLRLVEFRMPRPQLGDGHYISYFYFHGGMAVLAGAAALTCAAFDLSYAVGALGMVAAIQAAKAYGAQRGCNVVLEVYQWLGSDGRPYHVHELRTQHSRRRYPPVSEVLLKQHNEEPKKLTDLLKSADGHFCATLFMSQTLKDRPEI